MHIVPSERIKYANGLATLCRCVLYLRVFAVLRQLVNRFFFFFSNAQNSAHTPCVTRPVCRREYVRYLFLHARVMCRVSCAAAAYTVNGPRPRFWFALREQGSLSSIYRGIAIGYEIRRCYPNIHRRRSFRLLRVANNFEPKHQKVIIRYFRFKNHSY